MKRISILLIILITISLAGCSQADEDGIVLEVSEKQIRLAREISPEEYEEIKDKSMSDIQDEDASGDMDYGLIDLNYDKTEEFTKGDWVEVWLEDQIMQSYPPQANAKKITIKEN